MPRTGLSSLIAASVFALVVGCGQQTQENPDLQDTDPPVQEDVTDLEEYETVPPGLVDYDTGEVIEEHAVAQWDEESREAVVNAAVDGMTVFARPDLDYDTWWAGVWPVLSPDVQESYSYVDPARIPVSKVTGPGQIVDDASAYIARVEVPTDGGVYTLLLSREDHNAQWLIDDFAPPEQDM